MHYSRRADRAPLPYWKKDKQGIHDLFYEYSIIMPAFRADHWRMVQPDPNGVRGQPHFGCVLIRATDGIHALVENHERTKLIEIHLTNFMGVVKPQGYRSKLSMRASAPKKQTTKKKTTKKRKPKVTALTTFFNELLADK